MHKRGQLTIFIILFILICASLFLFLYSKNQLEVSANEKALSSNFEVNSIQQYVEECLANSGKDALYNFGFSSGYDKNAIAKLDIFQSNISYAYYEGVVLFLSLDDIEKRFSKYVEEKIPICVNNFSSFPGLSIRVKGVNAYTDFTNTSIIFSIDYPLEIQQGDALKKLSKFSKSFPVRFKHIYETAEAIVDMEDNNPELIDLNMLGDSDLIIQIFPLENDTIIYAIMDNQSVIENKPYTFIFANKFKFNSSTKSSLGKVVMMDVPDFNVTAGDSIEYRIETLSSEKVNFSVISDLDVTIDGDGKMDIATTDESLGVHYVKAEATTASGGSSSTIFRVTVKGR